MSVKRADGMGCRGRVFYRLRQRLEQYGPDGVHPKRRQARRGRPPAVPVQTERRVIAFALAWPTCGPQWYSDQLAREGVRDRAGDDLAPVAPAAAWAPVAARLAVLEHGSAATTGLLTERTAKPIRHVEAAQPGDLLSLDTFYVGKLKGVGKVWQITGCDVASSFGWARLIVGEVTAAAVLALPARGRATDAIARPAGGCAACSPTTARNSRAPSPPAASACGIRVTRTKPRHAWTNGFVERLQKTILHEHWRIAFRRQYFTGRRSLQALARSLSAVLQP